MLAMSSFNQNIYLEGAWSNYFCFNQSHEEAVSESYGEMEFTRDFSLSYRFQLEACFGQSHW